MVALRKQHVLLMKLLNPNHSEPISKTEGTGDGGLEINIHESVIRKALIPSS
jgi:hypothetical protein